MKVVFTVLSLFLSINLNFAQNNSFNGTFLNTQIGLSLVIQQNGQKISGQYQLQGQSYPITASLENETTLSGTYPYYGTDVPIQLMALNSNYILVTEGVTIPMAFTKAEAPSSDLQTLGASNKEEETVAIPIDPKPKSNNAASGRGFGDPNVGFRFNIPADWVGQQIEDGSYLIGHKTKPGFILIIPHQFSSLKQLHQESVQGIQEEGIHLIPTNGIQKYGKNGLTAEYKGIIQGQSVRANAIALMSPYGGGLNMLVAVKSDLYTQEYLPILQSIGRSVAFSKPKTSPIANQWKSRIQGKRLLYMQTSNGFSDKRTIDLCSSGQFGYNNNSSGMSEGLTTLTYAGQNAGQGTWKVINRGPNALLILSFNNGELYEYRLTNRESRTQVNLNGERYFIRNESPCN